MHFEDNSYNIILYKKDYGVPIKFDCEGFEANTKLVFLVETNEGFNILTKEYDIESDNPFEYEISLTKEESNLFVNDEYKYGFKVYKDGEYLDSSPLPEAKIIVEGVPKYDN